MEGEHLCHGEYVHHNIMFHRQETALVNFGHFEINVQVNDLCLFLRKIMEKHNWNGSLAGRMLTAYERELPLSGEERAIWLRTFITRRKPGSWPIIITIRIRPGYRRRALRSCRYS
ncbi:MAG: hypothetical protein V8Q40_11575 [Anaerosacchariphilus sp.]